jgi:hypothetical protein
MKVGNWTRSNISVWKNPSQKQMSFAQHRNYLNDHISCEPELRQNKQHLNQTVSKINSHNNEMANKAVFMS